MQTVRRYLFLYAAACMAGGANSAAAFDGISPSNAVCGLVNFSFCDQGAVPSGPAPSASGLAPGRPLPPPPGERAEDPRVGAGKPLSSQAGRAKGNCASGWFTTVAGERLQFIGPAKRRLEGDPRYVILHDGLRMTDTAASGYRDALLQFRNLCPKRVPVAGD